jgi:hypothetical protein
MTKPDLSLRDACLLREEHITIFYSGHNIGRSLHFLMMNASAHDSCLPPLNKVRIRAFEPDYCDNGFIRPTGRYFAGLFVLRCIKGMRRGAGPEPLQMTTPSSTRNLLACSMPSTQAESCPKSQRTCNDLRSMDKIPMNFASLRLHYLR